jgi:hypothetical protein
MNPLYQLSFDLPEPAPAWLEDLLAREIAREREDPSYGLLLIVRDEPAEVQHVS